MKEGNHESEDEENYCNVVYESVAGSFSCCRGLRLQQCP